MSTTESLSVVETMFESLLRSPADQQDELWTEVLKTATPDEIADIALHGFERHGCDRRLSLAAALLGDLGVHAWPVLRRIVERQRPECEYFVATIAHLPGVSEAERLETLKTLARNPSADVRCRVLDAIADDDVVQSRDILATLADAQESEIRDAARQRLANIKQ